MDTTEVTASAELPVETVSVQMQNAHTVPPNAPTLVALGTPAAPAVSQAGVTKTFYKRQLPSPPAIAFSSQEGALSCQGNLHIHMSTAGGSFSIQG